MGDKAAARSSECSYIAGSRTRAFSRRAVFLLLQKAGKFVAGTTFVSIAGGAWTPIQSCGPDFTPLYA